VLWTIITAVIFIGWGDGPERLGFVETLTMRRRDRIQVEVVAQQFQWNFHYAGKDNKFWTHRSEVYRRLGSTSSASMRRSQCKAMIQ
jgi:heme/copper-type cytochrome/quinol oxidase subunit 2